jgi:hypothetical protein
MKYELTTGTWQDDTGCPISIILVTTSDVGDPKIYMSIRYIQTFKKKITGSAPLVSLT